MEARVKWGLYIFPQHRLIQSAPYYICCYGCHSYKYPLYLFCPHTPLNGEYVGISILYMLLRRKWGEPLLNKGRTTLHPLVQVEGISVLNPGQGLTSLNGV